MKRHKWVPIAFFIVGTVFYIYFGITWNAWIKNLPNIAIYAVICLALWWALKKKEQYKNSHK